MNQTRTKQIFLNNTQLSAITIGQRIPKDYFITTGVGESDITVHAGSYHLALKDAGIENCNIMVYSSILPGVATEVEHPRQFVHGAVMETIMATATSQKGDKATAGIIFGWLYNKETNERFGGLVCEYNGNISEEEASASLNLSLQELYNNGYSEKYELRDLQLITRSFVVEKKFGTAIVAICFKNHIIPIEQQGFLQINQ
ncbi:MAG: pyruvoyl-dependent arginine decarboxylase [Candidatus Nanoarchaeia archaeon]|nr:pyruvoyl-dependent arginine decarboxylase [Candidatus Nanoarchaeia archaeon]